MIPHGVRRSARGSGSQHEQRPTEAQKKAFASAEALGGLNPREMLEVTLRQVLAILLTLRPRFERSEVEQSAFDLLCDDVEASLRRAVGEIPFKRRAEISKGRLFVLECNEVMGNVSRYPSHIGIRMPAD